MRPRPRWVPTRPGRALALGGAVLLVAATTAGSPFPQAVAAGRYTVVALGDSVPAGDECGCTPYPELVAAALTPVHGDPTLVRNLAVGGADAADALDTARTQESWLRAANVVIVTAGANDVEPFVEDPADRATQEQAVVQAAHDVGVLLEDLPPGPPGRRVVVTGYWAVGLDGAVARSTYTPEQERADRVLTAALDGRLRTVARAHHVSYLDLRPVFHGVSGHQDPTPLLADDGDHPSAAGHEAIAAALVRLLRT